MHFKTTITNCVGLRLLRLFSMVRASRIIESLEDSVSRVFFILFGVIYSFAIFAYICFGQIETTSAEDAGDDAQRWTQLSGLLNFRTFPQSLHTMFQLSIIGNWSSVMAAAAAEQSQFSYIFFYSYRILVAIIIMPILLSFVIQTYVAQRKKLQLQKQMDDAKLRKSTSAKGTDPVTPAYKYVEIFSRTNILDGDVQHTFEDYKVKAFVVTGRLRTDTHIVYIKHIL